MSGTGTRGGAADQWRERVERVRDRVEIVDVVGRAVKLGRGRNPRGKCPFHGSTSDSFTVYADGQRARCWGCGWQGDAIAFVRDHYGLDFKDALARLEADHGLDGLTAAPVRREKREQSRRDRPTVDSATMARHIWSVAAADPERCRVYLRARGVPEAMLADARLAQLRFAGAAPLSAWRENAKPSSVPSAPAMVALVRRVTDAKPIGLHVTYLSPAGDAKLERRRGDGELYPARKMLGAVAGGGVLLGHYDPAAPLFVGEGLETVLSGMAVADAPPAAIGLAALSLDNLQGRVRLIRGALPLHDPEPDWESGAVAFAHGGPVTVLVDADMAPLRGPVDRQTGGFRGVALIERAGGPVVHRTLSSAERSEVCGRLAVARWRGCGARAVAIRPRMGRDFNDAVREVGA